ncbi:cytochrome c oxidase subunit 1 [Thecaphora frezii]
MPKRSRQDADGSVFASARKNRCTDGAAGPSSHGAGRGPRPAAADGSNADPSCDVIDPSHFDDATALGLDPREHDHCAPVASGSRPTALPRTMDERFVPGLETFVGGLTMSQPLHQQANAPGRPPHRMPFDGVSIEPPPLVMSRRSQSSSRSSSPPRPSLDGTVRITNSGLTAPPTAPLVPGVSPGWHVESHGRQAMELHEGVRFQDEDGWTPLDAFPARTELGRNVARRARKQVRDLLYGWAPKEPRSSVKNMMSISSITQTAPPYATAPSEAVAGPSSPQRTRTASSKAQRNTSSTYSSPVLNDEVMPVATTSPTCGSVDTAMSSPQANPASSLALPQPVPQVWFHNGVPATGPRPGLLALGKSQQQTQPQPSQPPQTQHKQNAPGFQTDAPLPQSQYTLRDFEVLETLGTGTFGRVLLVRLKSKETTDPSAYFALKVLAKSKVVRLRQIEHTNSERTILAKVQHPFLVNLITTFQDAKNCYMLMDYVIGGEVFSYLRRAGRFSVDVTRFYISTIVLAIEYLHDRNIVYRDLKPENLLLDEHGYTKITDFGFAKEVEDRTWTLCGTPEYLAPEIIQSNGHGKAVDWWALGILLFEMLAGYPPFYDNQPFGVYEKILQGNIVFPAHIDEVSRDLIRSLLTADRSRRLGNLRGGAHDVKNHVWFHGVDWAQLERRNIRPPIVPLNTRAGDTSNFSKYERVRLSSLPGFLDDSSSFSSSEMDVGEQRVQEDPFAHFFASF